jgi:hypothetical protein
VGRILPWHPAEALYKVEFGHRSLENPGITIKKKIMIPFQWSARRVDLG